MKKIIIIVVAIVLVLAVAAAVIFLVVLPNQNKEPHDGSYPDPEGATAFFQPGEYFITNISESTKLCKLSLVIAYTDTTNEEQLKLYQPFFRNIIVQHLSTKTEEELRADGVIQQLSDELFTKITANFKVEYITGIYLTDFVVQ